MTRRKVCAGCKEEKDVSLFPKDTRIKSGIRSRCKACYAELNRKIHQKRGTTDGDRDRKLRKTFGISLEQYNRMFFEQDCRCAVCGKTEQENGKRLAVDHCHKTGKIRKLLCHHCNCALGMVNDNKDTLAALISYLMENEQ